MSLIVKCLPMKAQQDLRSYRNAGVFNGENPDQFGNQNTWGVYSETRILELLEAESWRPQCEVDANTRIIVVAVNHHADLVRALDNARTVLGFFWRKGSVPPALLPTPSMRSKCC